MHFGDLNKYERNRAETENQTVSKSNHTLHPSNTKIENKIDPKPSELHSSVAVERKESLGMKDADFKDHFNNCTNVYRKTIATPRPK